MEPIAMSLDEIIKSKKLSQTPKTRPAKPTVSPLKTKRLGTLSTSPKTRASPVLVDARNKIIQRNRSKITDAREKLAQITKQSGDVRQKLLRKQQKLQQQQHGATGGLRKGPGGLISASASARNAAQLPAGRGARVARAGGHAVQRIGVGRVVDDDDDDVAMMEVDFVPAEYALRRTVHNDIAYSKMPPLPQFSRTTVPRGRAAGAPYHPAQQNPHHQPQQHHHHHQTMHMSHHASPPHQQQHHHNHHQRVVRPSPPPMPSQHHYHQQQQMWSTRGSVGGGGPDPFDCYEVPMQRPLDVSEPKNLQRQIRGAAHPDLIPTKGILRYSARESRASPPPPPPHHRGGGGYGSPYDEHNLSYEMRTRLERAPDAGASAGTFSNPYALHHSSKPKLVQQPQQQQSHHSIGGGYRIVVSNLHGSVSQSDIRELFEDIGELVEARLVRPGVAEVIFRTMKDAELAVDTYHNRQLDGQPMKCLLVQPRPVASRPTAPAIKSSAGRSTSSSNAPPSTSSLAASKSGKTPLEIDIDALHKVLFQPKSYARN